MRNLIPGVMQVINQYISWDASSPGISFCLSSGRISVFLKTLGYLSYPEFIRFLFNPESGMFVVQACGMNDEGAKPLLIRKWDEAAVINTIDLVRLVYSSCGWNPRFSYRVAGVFFQRNKLVRFDLNEALEVHEWRLTSLADQ